MTEPSASDATHTRTATMAGAGNLTVRTISGIVPHTRNTATKVR